MLVIISLLNLIEDFSVVVGDALRRDTLKTSIEVYESSEIDLQKVGLFIQKSELY